MENYILNVKKSVDDERDFIYKQNEEMIPLILDLRNDLQPVRDQGNQGTCYAQSAACMKEWQEKKDYGFDDYFSPQFFYNNRDYWNNDKQDGEDYYEDYGMTGRDVMKILKEVGICKESDYPYKKIETANEISNEIKEKAKKHVVKKYARIYELNDLKSSLFKNGPCLIAFPVYNYGPEMWKQQNNEKMSGGHAMTVVGYNENSFIIRNSWGSYWNDSGYCYYKFEDWGEHWELWTTIDDVTVEKTEIDEEVIDEEENEQDEEIEELSCLKKIMNYLSQNTLGRYFQSGSRSYSR